MFFEKYITVDLLSGTVADAALGPVFRQDKTANRLGVNLLSGGEPLPYVSGSVKALIMRADGETLSVDGSSATYQGPDSTVERTVAYVDLPETAYAVQGPLSVAIRLHAPGGDRTTLAVYRGNVVRTAGDNILDPEQALEIRTVDAAYMEAVLDDIEQAVSDARSVTAGAVRYDVAQPEITASDQETARENIGAAAALTENEQAVLAALGDGAAVGTDCSGSSGRSASIPISIKSGETVYVDVDFETTASDRTYGVYLSDGVTTPHPQSQEMDGPGRATFVASRDYVAVLLWFNTAPVSVSARVSTSAMESVARRITGMTVEDEASQTTPTSSTSKLFVVQLHVMKGEALYVNVSDIVCASYTQHQIALGNSVPTMRQVTTVPRLGLTRMIAEQDYSYVYVYVDGTSVTGAQITVCRDKRKSRYATYSILGDSYSAYEGTIPSGNLKSYPISGNDVNDASQMWWRVYGDQNGAQLGLNESWSGASVCNYAYGADQSDKSFAARVRNLPESDLIFILGGTNDDWGNAVVGDYIYSGWTAEQLNQFRPAFAYVLSWLQAYRPASDVVVILNTGLRADYLNSMKTIAAHYGVPAIELSNISKIQGHPDKAGMANLGAQVSGALLTRVVPGHDDDGSLTALGEQISTVRQEMAANVGTLAEFRTYLGIT